MAVTRILLSFFWGRLSAAALRPTAIDEGIKAIDDALLEAFELRSYLMRDFDICAYRTEESCG